MSTDASELFDAFPRPGYGIPPTSEIRTADDLKRLRNASGVSVGEPDHPCEDYHQIISDVVAGRFASLAPTVRDFVAAAGPDPLEAQLAALELVQAASRAADQEAIPVPATFRRRAHLFRALAEQPSAAAVAQLTVELLGYLARGLHAGPEAPPEVRLLRVKHYLEFFYYKEIDLARLANIAFMSPAYLSRRFRALVGIPPRAYLVRQRIRRARDLLQTDSRSVADVAASVGFDDFRHFSRTFKRMVGLAPSQYRRIHSAHRPTARDRARPHDAEERRGAQRRVS